MNGKNQITFSGDRALLPLDIPGPLGGALASEAEERGVRVIDVVLERITAPMKKAEPRLAMHEWVQLAERVAKVIGLCGVAKNEAREVTYQLMARGLINGNASPRTKDETAKGEN